MNGVLFASTFYKFHSTVYKSTDDGNTWQFSGNGLPFGLSFVFGLTASGNNIIAGTDEGLYYSSDEGGVAGILPMLLSPVFLVLLQAVIMVMQLYKVPVSIGLLIMELIGSKICRLGQH